MFLRKKESKNAPPKAQKPSRTTSSETIVFQKKAATTKPEVKKKESESIRKRIQRFLSVGRLRGYFSLKNRKKFYSKQIPSREKPKPDSLFKQYETDLQLALIPLILLAILSMLMMLNNHYIEVIEQNKVTNVESISSLQPFPLAENIIPPDISAKAAIVVDADSQVILLSKNPDLRFSMASTTKIMTALTGLDYFKEDEVLTVKSSGVEGSVIGLQPGEQLTFRDLLYAMMLPSANDAAVAVADNYVDGKEAFIDKMNDKALLLHLTNTHFADPAGLNDDENYTTAVDLARLGSYAMKNKTFAEIVGTKQKTFYNTYYSKEYYVTNLNKLLGVDGVNGIKTGTTEGAGEVLVTSMVANGHTYIIVVMNSTNRFADTQELMSFVTEKVKYIVPSEPK